MSLVVDTLDNTDGSAILEAGYYIIDSSDQVGPGPYRNIEHARLYRQAHETIAYYSGAVWHSVNEEAA